MREIVIQTVVYNNEFKQIIRWLETTLLAAEKTKLSFSIKIGFNDNQGDKFHDLVLKNFPKRYSENLVIFNSAVNTGHGALHNFMFDNKPFSRFLAVSNPDGTLHPAGLLRFYKKLTHDSQAAYDARQIPYGHPKRVEINGETTWISGAFMFLPSRIFKEVGGFDPRFFLHCDDIDLSWRIHLAGYKLKTAADVTFYHEKEVGVNGYIKPTEAETYYGPLGSLLLAQKYGFNKMLREMINEISRNKLLSLTNILQDFESKKNNQEVQGIDPKDFSTWRYSRTFF
jgi:hypothetical protein